MRSNMKVRARRKFAVGFQCRNTWRGQGHAIGTEADGVFPVPMAKPMSNAVRTERKKVFPGLVQLTSLASRLKRISM
jgi:hypothetical protein